jgi:hypothetical protein
LVLGAFDERGHPGGALAVCPPEGTAGFIPVELAGGYFSAYQKVNVMMNGTSIATETADRGGNWILNVSGFVAPLPDGLPNGTQFTFTTSPPSLTSPFTTVEGIRASPGSGAPGTSVLVEGRSYPSYSSVLVYLGGASLGTAQADIDGSFQMQAKVPFVSPLIFTGTYSYSTFPAILGSGASFVSAGGLVTLFSSWWWWLLLIILILIIAYLVRRRMKRRKVPPGQGESQPTS